MNAAEQVILVDVNDVVLGAAEKLEAHRRGLTHRAVSVFVRNAAGALLLQQRSLNKYHSGGKWANACCTHPQPGESTAAAARRRLAQELGFVCPLEPLFTMHYRAAVSAGLIEDEVAHVFGGLWDGPIAPAPAEVSAWKWMHLAELFVDLRAHPENYAVWLRQYLYSHGAQISTWLARAP